MFIENNYTDFTLIEEGIEEKGSIIISNYKKLKEEDFLIEKKITHVLTILPENYSNFPLLEKLKIEQKIINTFNEEKFKIFPDLEIGADFINKGISEGNLLIHCAGGLSGSIAFLIGFYIKYKKLKMFDILINLKNKMILANPNRGFKRELKKFEIKMLKYNK